MKLSTSVNSEESDLEDDSVSDVQETVEEDENEDQRQPRPKKQKLESNARPNPKKDLYKQPTIEELNNLKEAETLFLSSLFRMQSSELLKEVKIKEKWKPYIDAWLAQFKSTLEGMKPGKKHDLSDNTWLKKTGIKIPIVQEPAENKGVFLFKPSTNINVVGSYCLDLVCLPDFVIDVAVEIPSECWQHGDFLNHRYHRKRALYLAHIANKLRKSELSEEMKFAYQHSDYMRPTLIVKPRGKAGKHCLIQILPHPPESFFKISRLIPSKNNVRPLWYFGNDITEDVATPHYNSSMIIDLVLLKCLEYQTKVITDSQNVRDGILLLKVWLRQRELSSGFGGFSGFIVTMFVLYLVSLRKISRMMSSYQVMRSALLALSNMKWNEQGISLAENSELAQLSLADFHNYFETVFVGPSGFMNLCANMSKLTYSVVSHEAELAIRVLDGNVSDSFETLFMKPVVMYEKFDHILYLENICQHTEIINSLNAKTAVLDYSGNVAAAILPKIAALLQKAVGKRIRLLAHSIQGTCRWLVTELPPDAVEAKRLVFGLLINPNSYASVLEKGPQADSPEAKEFREFWGEKSELRRFQDGSICEAVTFSGKSLAERRVVMEKMVKYILSKHAGIPESSVIYVCNPLDSLLMLENLHSSSDLPPYGTGDEAIINVMHSYTELAKILHKVDLPLTVTAVHGISSIFCSTEVFPALPNYIAVGKKMVGVTQRCMTLKSVGALAPQYVQPLEIVIQLEGSGKWPDDVDAIRHLKAAFHIQLAKALNSTFNLLAIASVNHVDIMKDGYVFRVIVSSTKEVMLLKQKKNSEGIVKIAETVESQELHYKTLILPQITSTLQGIQQQHNLYGVAARLAKRWIASHMLSDYMNEICVDFIVASLFLNPYPFSVPGSITVAFLRFLNLIATFDWRTNPLIINLNGELKQDDYANIHSHFTSHRPTLPPMFIATPFDKFNSYYTRFTPNGTILLRVKLLAETSVRTLKEQLESPAAADFKQIFRPPLDPYDVVIHLKPLMISKRHMAVDAQKQSFVSHKKDDSQSEVMPVLDYDPIHFYLKDLKDSFEEFALFFYDCFGGNFIGVVWKPKTFTTQEFKVSHINGRMVSSGKAGDIIPNVEAILENFAILGNGIVRQIETNTEKWVID